MAEISQSELSRKYFISTWVIVCTVSYGLGILFGDAAGEKIGFPIGNRITSGLSFAMQWIVSAAIAGLLSGTVLSAITSVFQWLVLRKSLVRAALWIPLSMTGEILGSVFGSIVITAFILSVGDLSNSLYYLIFGSLVLSPVLGWLGGYFEWILLREQSSQAKKWIPARVIATGISTLIFTLSILVRPIINSELGQLAISSSGFISGIAFGIFTGFSLHSIITARTEASTNIDGS